MFIENPWLPLGIGLLFCIACLVLWYTTRHPLPLVAGAVSLVLTAVLVATSIAVATPRERLEQTIHRLAMAAQQNDKELLLSMISPSALNVRQDADREMDATTFVRCWIGQIKEVQIDDDAKPPHARVFVAVVADVERSYHGAGRGLVQLWLEFDLEADGQWRVTRYNYRVE